MLELISWDDGRGTMCYYEGAIRQLLLADADAWLMRPRALTMSMHVLALVLLGLQYEQTLQK